MDQCTTQPMSRNTQWKNRTMYAGRNAQEPVKILVVWRWHWQFRIYIRKTKLVKVAHE